MKFKLPNGLIDGMDRFDYVVIDELRGKQQNYLANQKLIVGNIGHVPKILEDLVLSFETEQGLKWKGKVADGINKIPSQDIEAILIKIREKTFGPKFYFEGQCPHCGHLNKNLRLDLDQLEMKYMSMEDMLKPKTVELPKAKEAEEPFLVTLRPAYMDDLFKVVKLTAGKETDELVTSIVSIAIKSIGDKDSITQKDIENIRSSDLFHLQKELEKVELAGSIDTEIITTCKECEKEFEEKLNSLDPNFFDPTKGSPTSAT